MYLKGQHRRAKGDVSNNDGAKTPFTYTLHIVYLIIASGCYEINNYRACN